MYDRYLGVLSGAAVAAAACVASYAQAPVSVGSGSYAPAPPAYKARTDEHAGFNASRMLTRQIFAVETDAEGNPRPIPTNDWWTDLLNNRFSGAMWSYPAMIKTSAQGVDICYPTQWNENGTEVKPDSRIRVGAKDFTAADATAYDWHDWDVEIMMASAKGRSHMLATLVHGNPFTLVEFSDATPELAFSQAPELVARDAEGLVLRIGNDIYGIWHSSEAEVELAPDMLRINGTDWVSVGLLPSAEAFDEYGAYAATAVRSTTVSWEYDERTSTLTTNWDVRAENLRDSSADAPVMQGFLPHAYKHMTGATLPFDGTEYLTPRGQMKMARSDRGHYSYAYRFGGMLPCYAAPDSSHDPGYDHEVMRKLMSRYAAEGGFGADTYWGGKGLTQMALNMTFARQTGEEEIYTRSKAALRAALEDWLTYTPGEETRFFSYYPRWGGMLGFDVSYDSDAFNDHHFHYGYFIYAAALLCMEDPDFAAGYGEILRMIAKDYANYDRHDTRFPFLRTLDPWAGHSYAGGLGDHGNDNGNGQESSSEAMQGWGGVYMLGVALGDKDMRDAGIFGWLTESHATAEYWFDRDHIHPDRTGNYDYSLYTAPYNTNITSKGIGWWTWFSGDPLWMHSIQWMPVSPCLNYLSDDLDFVKWDYETMIGSTSYRWFEDSKEGGPLAEQSVGNVVLCYMERYDPKGAAKIFDEALAGNFGIARSVDTGHISYYVIHNHLTYGEREKDVTADIPTANCFRRDDGSLTYIVYNPDAAERTVTFSRDGVAERSVTAPGRSLTVFDADAHLDRVSVTSIEGNVLPPGAASEIRATAYDQYGAQIPDEPVTVTVEGPATLRDGILTVSAGAARGTEISVTATCGDVSETLSLTVNDKPRVVRSEIKGVPAIVETGSTLALSLETEDQYGATSTPAAKWTVKLPDGTTETARDGRYSPQSAGVHTVTATYDGNSADRRITVLPPLPNVARGTACESSSEENAGTLTSNATDGDPGSRWGSQHTDSEWIMLDLGREYDISYVSILWEAAYAADYDVETAPDTDGEPVWSVAYSQRGLSQPGKIRHAVDARGRFVRINCLRRGTDYGYSLFEIEVGGLPADMAADAPVGIDITLPATALEGEKCPLAAMQVRRDGSLSEAKGVTWSSDHSASFDGDSFTPQAYGLHTVTASLGSLQSSRQLLVEESTKLKDISVTPSSLSLLTGETGLITAEGRNQFGGVHPLDTYTTNVRITDGNGLEVTDGSARYDIESGEFRADVRGDYTLDFNGLATAAVAVRDVSEANLASGRPARASSSRDGNIAARAFDDDMGTRWESEWADSQWLMVNLQTRYMLNRVEIHWEGAYAREYSIDTSTDGENWTRQQSVSDGRGGHETVTFPEADAQYVRLNCEKRIGGYGNSVHEMQVYGTRRSSVETDISTITDSMAETFEVCTLQGILVGASLTREELQALQPGLYIVNKRVVRIE